MSGALVSDLCAQLQASDDDTRIAALKSLTADDCLVPAVREQLTIAIYSPSAAIRIAGLSVWNRCGGGSDPQVVTQLTDPVNAVRLAAYHVVLGWESADFVTYVSRGLRDRSVAIRLFVLACISTAPTPLPVSICQECLSDNDYAVANKAAEILAVHQDPLAIDWLLTRYQSTVIHVKKQIIRICGNARVAQAVPLLLNEVATRSDFMIPAIYALGMIAHPDALRPLLAQICSPVLGVANAAVTSLIRYQHPLVVTAMRQAVNDPRKMVSCNAVAVLAAYHFVPDIAISEPYFRHGELAYANYLVQAYLNGDSTTIMAALTTLHTLDVFQGNYEYIRSVRTIIRNHPEFETLVWALLASPQLFLVRLGVAAIDKTIINEAIMLQLSALYAQPDFGVQDAVHKSLQQLANSAPHTIVLYWHLLPVVTKEQCIRYVLLHPDDTIRAYALYDTDEIIRLRCMRFFCKMDSDTLRTTLAQFRATEVAHIATWSFDEQIHQHQLTNGIVDML